MTVGLPFDAPEDDAMTKGPTLRLGDASTTTATAPAAPEAPSAIRMAPATIQARRATASRLPVAPTSAMLTYRDALLELQPATDHAVSAQLRRRHGVTDAEDGRFGLSTMNGRRNDWLALDPTCIEAVDRIRAGRAWRTVWRVRPGSVADPARGGR